jgi:hypothetical protein
MTPSVLSSQVAGTRLLEAAMRIVVMGLLVGSALGALAATATSAYVLPKPHSTTLQSYQYQANSSDTRSWDI